MDEQVMVRIGKLYHKTLQRQAEKMRRTLRAQLETLIDDEETRLAEDAFYAKQNGGNGHDAGSAQ
jgi:hypothetical protein